MTQQYNEDINLRIGKESSKLGVEEVFHDALLTYHNKVTSCDVIIFGWKKRTAFTASQTTHNSSLTYCLPMATIPLQSRS